MKLIDANEAKNYKIMVRNLRREADYLREKRSQYTIATELEEATSAIEMLLSRLNPPNPPLTLEELREMELNTWLWIDILIPAAYRRMKSGYYETYKDYTYGEAFCCGWPGTICDFDYIDYGKTWLAYRRKPEEGTT